MDALPAKFVWFIYKGQPIEDIPRHITHLLVDPSVDEIEDYAFQDCKDLLSVVVPTAVRRIGFEAFAECRLLSDVQLYEGLETIASSAFARCALVQIHLHKGITSIWPRAFEFCKRLVDIDLPEGLECVDFRTFGGCSSLCTVSMPSTMKRIGRSAFEDCTSLVHVYLNEGLRSIGESAFKHCTAVSAIALPSSVDEIESQAFQQCIGLVGFEIPDDSIVAIPNDCFDWCRSLVNVSIPPFVDPRCLRLLPVQGKDACNRYAYLPVHRLCYNSTHTTIEELMEALTTPGMLDDDKLKDSFDITPFHIVATSSSLRVDILECLLDHYRADVIWATDYQGHTMMDYLLKNKSSKALDLMRMVLYKLHAADIFGWDMLGSKRFDVLDDSKVVCHDSNTREAFVKEILGHVGYYYRIETRSIMEQALWKMRIDEMAGDSGSSDIIDRASCRYRYGAEDVVKSAVEYLWDCESSTYSTAISTYPKLDFYKLDSDPDSGSDIFETTSYRTTRWFESDSDSDESWSESDASSSSELSSSDSEESEQQSDSSSSSSVSESSTSDSESSEEV